MLGNVLVISVAAVCAWYLWENGLKSYYSPLLALPAPPIPSKFYGHVRQVCNPNSIRLLQEWQRVYGNNILTRWLFLGPALWTADTRAVNHILHSGNYVKPWEGRISAARIVGNSVIVAEGDEHRKQRKILNPAFGPAQIRELTPIFFEKAAELRDRWQDMIAHGDKDEPIDIVNLLKKMTLDVIGLAGFGCHLDALNAEGRPTELGQAFHHIFNATPKVSLFRIVMDMIPQLDFFPDERTKTINEARATMRRIGLQLIRDKREAILRARDGKDSTEDGIAKKDVQGRDLLSLLIKANLATDVPEDQCLSEEQVLSQIPTFLTAGHETTSMATAWCLYALTQSPRAQAKLRAELSAVTSDAPSMDELMALPYLDYVVRETMRLHAPVTFTLRCALADDVIPTSEPYKDRNGVVRSEIRIAKGNRVIVPLLAINQSTALWGEDALEFRPERWEHPPEEISNIPGVWSHLLTFNGGPRACIGYRFSITELKALIFTLIRAFEFELAADPADITRVGMFTQRPALASQLKKGAQLPMRIRPCAR